LIVDGKRIVDIPSALGASEDTATMLGNHPRRRADAGNACARSRRRRRPEASRSPT